MLLFSPLAMSDSVQSHGLQLDFLHSLLELTQTQVHWAMKPSKHLIFCHPLLLLPTVFPSIRVFSKELALHIKWLKYWNFSISHSNEYSGLISFGIDWFDLFALHATLKSLLQHHILKASILQCSAFFMVQLSHLYIVLTVRTFVGKVMLLLFNMLSRLS